MNPVKNEYEMRVNTNTGLQDLDDFKCKTVALAEY